MTLICVSSVTVFLIFCDCICVFLLLLYNKDLPKLQCTIHVQYTVYMYLNLSPLLLVNATCRVVYFINLYNDVLCFEIVVCSCSEL